MTKKRTFLVWRPISKAIFQKLKPASKNPRAGNRRWIFPEKESVLTWKIGVRQPLFLAVLKFVVEVPFEKWRVSSSTLLFSAHAWTTMAFKTKQWPIQEWAVKQPENAESFTGCLVEYLIHFRRASCLSATSSMNSPAIGDVAQSAKI